MYKIAASCEKARGSHAEEIGFILAASRILVSRITVRLLLLYNLIIIEKIGRFSLRQFWNRKVCIPLFLIDDLNVSLIFLHQIIEY